jgi:diguanylate cyclase (GGDEF)-like protein
MGDSATARILLLDSDPTSASIAGDTLAGWGYEVSAFDMVEPAVELLHSDDGIDVVVVDVFSRGFEGLALLEKLRLPHGFSLPPSVIVLTTRDDADTAVLALQGGASDYIVKPVSADRLLSAVERILEQRAVLTDSGRLRRDLALFAAGQRLLETLDERQLASRGLSALSTFTGADAAACLGKSGVLNQRGLEPAEIASCEQARLAHRTQLHVRPVEVGASLERFSDCLLLDLGSERWALLFRRADSHPQAFSEAEEQNALFLSRHLSTGFRHATIYTRAEQRARRDPLTGLYNARAFEEALHHAVLRGRLEDENLCVLFLDCDHFKTINDDHGHLLGSQLLVEVGHAIQRCVRDHDVVGRFGGDEFVALVDGANLEVGLVVAERIRSVIERATFLQRNDGPRVKITVSIGLSAFPDHAADARTLLDLADKAMYEGKEASRNVVRIAGENVREES